MSTDDPSQRLVELIQDGIDREANFKRLFELHDRRIRSYFLQRGLSSEETKDLTQEVFLRVHRGLGSFRQESKFKTWLFEIADHLFQNELRRRSTAKRQGSEISIDTGGQDEEGKPAPFEPPPKAPTALDDVLKRERIERLSRAIQNLPPKMRQCFQLRYEQGRKYEEIAVLTNVSIDTVKAHLHQAKVRLKLDLSES